MTDTNDLRHDDGSPSSYEIVEHFWAYDGPHSRETMASAATTLAELVRYLNNSTQYGVSEAPTLWRIIAQVSTAVDRFDQLLDQLERAAETLADDATMYDAARREPPHVVALLLADNLSRARQSMDEPRRALDAAAQVASRLGHRSEGEA